MAKVLGIEVGYSLTRICEIDYKVKTPKIYKYISIPTPQGVVDDGFMADNAEFVEIIRKVLAENKIKTKQVVFSVASSKIATREIVLPVVKENQLSAMIKANATDYFPIDLSEYEIAHLLLGMTVGENGKPEKYKVMVMAAGKNLIGSYERFANNCGLHLQSLDYTGNSIFQIMKNEVKEETEMVIKVEERSAVATVISNHTLALQRTVVYGVDDAVTTLMRSPVFEEKSYKDALEAMKRKTCIKLALNENTKIIEGEDAPEDSERVAAAKREVTNALTPLVQNISKVVDLYNSKNQDNHIKKIYLIGLGADISGLSKLFTNELGIRTIVLNDLKSINWNRQAGESNPGKFIATIGATYAPVGFINEEKKKDEAQSTNYKIITVLVAVVFLGISVGLTIMAVNRYRAATDEENRLKRLEAEYVSAEAVYNQYNQFLAFYKELETGYRLTEHPNDNLLAFLEELEQKLPADAELSEFTSDDEQATLVMKVANKEEAAKVIQTLREFDSVMDVSIGALDKKDEEAATTTTADGEEVPDTRVSFSVVCSYYIFDPNSQAAAATEVQ